MKPRFACQLLLMVSLPLTCFGQVTNSALDPPRVSFGPYEYETKPDHVAFSPFNPRRAPEPGPLLLEPGDRLAICGDSITEQKMYSRIIETYLTACVPHLDVTVRQYGWSGETAQGFLNRMDKDCLTFNPTVATLAYGMNDARYRPFDVNNGKWYEDHYSAIVQKFKEQDVRVVVGSPGCAGKIATWVKAGSGTLQEHNLHLCALRDIGIGIAQREEVRFADIFWPMFQAQVFAPGQHHATAEKPYQVAGADGIHPGWAGQVIMAYAFLRSLGLNGNIGTIEVNLTMQSATASVGHDVGSFSNNIVHLTSSRLPFCARGDLHSDSSIRSGMTLVPFTDDLNRFVLKVTDADVTMRYRVTWGESSVDFAGDDLIRGISLPVSFPENPLCEMFDRVDKAVAAKQAYETEQVKKIFHGPEGKADFQKAVADTEAIRQPLADAVSNSLQSVSHSIAIQVMQ